MKPIVKIPDGNIDILMVSAPHFNVLYPPSGIAYICEAVRNGGFRPAVIDINNALINRFRNNGIDRFWHVENSIGYWMGEGYPEVENIFGESFDEAADIIAGCDAPVIGFSVNMLSMITTDRIAKRVRKKAPDKIIIYGGYSCYHDDICRTLSDQPDYICVGESENTITELMKALLENGDPGALPGVMEVRAGRGRYVPRTRTEDLDTIAWPTWKEFDLSRYRTLHEFVTVSVNASRGCAWGRCHFCSDFNSTPGFRRRSAKSLVAEMKYGVTHNDVTNFHLSDLIVNGDHQELKRFCDLVIESGLEICFSGQFHIDKRLTPDLLKKLKKAGMPIINFGMETGSDRMMKMMRKGHNVRLAEECLISSREAGLITDVNLLVGFPGETEEDINETIGFLERNRRYIDIVEVVNICSIQYGSPLWENHEDFGVVFDKVPGLREERFWVSKDGSNTFDVRVERAETLKKKIEDLGIGKGYHSQEFHFIREGESIFNPALFTSTFLAGIKKYGLHGEMAKTLVLRTCGMEQALTLVAELAKAVSGARLDLLCQRSAMNDFSPLLPQGSVFACTDGPLSIDTLDKDMFNQLRETLYDLVIVPMGVMPRYTYRNILSLAEQLHPGKVVFISISGEIEQCNSDDVHGRMAV